MLDLWLMVVMWAWMFDIALSAILNGGRFDLGFYVGRTSGLLAASFVLMVLLIENSVLYARLIGAHASERRERRRAAQKLQLEAANKELDAYAYSISHDLRAPLRAIDGYAEMLAEDYVRAGRRSAALHPRDPRQHGADAQPDRRPAAALAAGCQGITTVKLDMDALVREVIDEVLRASPARPISTSAPCPHQRRRHAAAPGMGQPDLQRRQVQSCLRPARDPGGKRNAGENVYSVRDNGVGFDMKFSDKLFGVFQRLHHADEFPGTGIGLAIVQRLVARHGGRVWGEGRTGDGAVFYFALPAEAG